MTRPIVTAPLLACSLAARVALAQSGPLPPPPESRPLPAAVQQVDIEEKLGMPLPGGLTFTDDNGARVRLSDLFSGGKPVVLVLAYYHCPMLCDLVLAGAVDALKKIDFRLHRDYRAITVSFDPRDRPSDAQAKKNNVLHALGQPGPWPFLVGDEANIKRLTDAVGFRYAFDPATDQYAHAAVVLVLTPDARVSRYLYGVSPRPRDLRFALLEASGGRIGGIVDRVLMTCYRYDPASRRYGVYIMGILRLGSLAVLVAIAGFLALLWRRDRRRQA